MARISGIDLPKNKTIEFALQYIYGIGHATALQILNSTDVDPVTRVQEISEEDVLKIRNEIADNYTVEGENRGLVTKKYQKINGYWLL